MAKYQRFEDLPVWRESSRLYNTVLDFLEEPALPLTPTFRSQLDRATLSISNNIAEAFERSAVPELLTLLAKARGSADEVRSMMAAVKDRPRLKPYAARLNAIRSLADSCSRQLAGWAASLDKRPFDGHRGWPQADRAAREAAQKAKAFRDNFLKNLKPEHPLYKTPEARIARGEKLD